MPKKDGSTDFPGKVAEEVQSVRVKAILGRESSNSVQSGEAHSDVPVRSIVVSADAGNDRSGGDGTSARMLLAVVELPLAHHFTAELLLSSELQASPLAVYTLS